MTRQIIADKVDWVEVEGRLESTLLAATAAQTADGLGWYDAANATAQEIALIDFPPRTTAAAAGMIAALSPQAEWSANIAAARDWAAGNPQPNVAARCDKAERCWSGEDPVDVLRGPKESAFYASIIDPTGCRSACIDRHMLRAALAIDTDAEIKKWAKRAQVYERIADAIATIADRHQIPVPACQAIIWNVIRDGRRA